MRPLLENSRILYFSYDVTSSGLRHCAQQSLRFGRGSEALVPEAVCTRRVLAFSEFAAQRDHP
jgi:hypothetical protein